MEISADQQEILLDFVAESRDHLDNAEPMLIDMGVSIDPEEIETAVGTIFRLFHSLKGGAGFLGFKTIERVTHTAENLLQLIRKDTSTMQPEHIDLFTTGCDLIQNMLNQVESEFHDEGFEEQAEVIIQGLEQGIAQASGDAPPPPAAPAKEELPPPPVAPVKEELPPSETPRLSPEQQEESLSPQLMLEEFFKDTSELLEKAEGALLVLDQLPGDVNTEEFIHTVFRGFHTIKGNAGVLNLSLIEELTHHAENLLEEIKTGKVQIDKDTIQLLLDVIDVLRHGIQQLSENKELDVHQFEETLAKLGYSKEQKPGSSESPFLGDILVDMGAADPEAIDAAIERQHAPVGTHLVEMGVVTPQDLEKALDKQAKAVPKTDTKKPAAPKRQDIRINLDKVDQLINLVGELVIAEAMIVNHSVLRNLPWDDFEDTFSPLATSVRHLRDITMSMRMIPISPTFRKMVRVVHDVAKKVDKQAKLELIGEETEVDKTLAEQIADPLLHIIRNAVDHGLEIPAEREAAGKPPGGTIRLEAKQSGNEVLIIIQDDGKGLNRERILERAFERELIPSDAEPADNEIWKLIFEPGFSTVEKVSDLSGRGVGMDVVKRNLEKLGGRIDIVSHAGQGSTFTLRIPLTITIVEGLLFRVGEARYAIPIQRVREAIEPSTLDLGKSMNNSEMLILRGTQIPIIRLHEVHHLTPRSTRLEDGTLLIIEENEQHIGLFVDEVVGQQQIVVKALPKCFGNLPHLAGCTILSDGEVGLILDLSGMFQTITHHHIKENRAS